MLPLPFVTVVFFWLEPGRMPEPAVVVHEAAHAVQIEEHGVMRFVATYLWDLALRGYAENRYERAARDAADEIADLDAERLRPFVP